MRVLWLFNDYCAIPSFKCLLYSELFYGDRRAADCVHRPIRTAKGLLVVIELLDVQSLFVLTHAYSVEMLVSTSVTNQMIRCCLQWPITNKKRIFLRVSNY